MSLNDNLGPYEIPGDNSPKSDMDRANKSLTEIKRLELILDEALKHPSANRTSIARKLVLIKRYNPKQGEKIREDSRGYFGKDSLILLNELLNGYIQSAKNTLEEKRQKYNAR